MRPDPLNDRVLVRQVEAEQKSGLLYLPDTAREKPQEGVVIGFGPKVTQVEVGDRVLFGKYSGSDIKINSEDFLILKEEDILIRLVEE